MRKTVAPSQSLSEQEVQTEPESESSGSEVPPTIHYPGEQAVAPNAAASSEEVRKLYGLPPREKPKPVDYVGGKLRITIVANKSYITVQAQGLTKPTMLVGLEKRMADAHGKSMEQVILQLWDIVIRQTIVSKDVAVSKRQELLEA